MEDELDLISLNEVRATLTHKSSLLTQNEDAGNKITGKLVSNTLGFAKDNIYVIIGAIIIIGLIMYLFLSGTVFNSSIKDSTKTNNANVDSMTDAQAMIKELKNSLNK